MTSTWPPDPGQAEDDCRQQPHCHVPLQPRSPSTGAGPQHDELLPRCSWPQQPLPSGWDGRQPGTNSKGIPTSSNCHSSAEKARSWRHCRQLAWRNHLWSAWSSLWMRERERERVRLEEREEERTEVNPYLDDSSSDRQSVRAAWIHRGIHAAPHLASVRSRPSACDDVPLLQQPPHCASWAHAPSLCVDDDVNSRPCHLHHWLWCRRRDCSQPWSPVVQSQVVPLHCWRQRRHHPDWVRCCSWAIDPIRSHPSACAVVLGDWRTTLECAPRSGWSTGPAPPSYTHPGTAYVQRRAPAPPAAPRWRWCVIVAACVSMEFLAPIRCR